MAKNSPPLLTYKVTTDPDPLQAQSTGSIQINIEKPASQQIRCKQIIISMPYGTGTTDLFIAQPNSGLIAQHNTGWALSTVSGQGNQSTSTYTLNNNNKGNEIPATFSFVVTGKVNLVNELVQFSIQETSQDLSSKGSGFSKKTENYQVDIFPARFYLSSFIASSPTSPNIVSTLFSAGQAIQLSWLGNGQNYEVFQGNNNTPIYNGQSLSCPVKGITKDSTFTLVSTKKDLNGNLNTLFQTLTLTVSNPELTPSSIAVSGNMAVTGTITGVGICPIGTIIMYGGAVTSFDSTGAGIAGTDMEGWQVCNGQNSSPDLIDKFVSGAANNNSVTTGGNATATLATDNLPAHNHTGNIATATTGVYLPNVAADSGGTSYGLYYSLPGANAPGHGDQPHAAGDYNLPFSIDTSAIADPGHTHTIDIADTGSNTPFSILPPFYALVYLIKIS